MSNHSYASLGKRTLSFFIDDIVVSSLFIAIFFEQISEITTAEEMVAFVKNFSWLLFLLKVIYHTFFIANNGATIGKYFTKIKAVDENSGEVLSWSRAFLRALIRSIGELLFYITFIFAFFDDKKQTLHDKISRCVVVDV